MTHTLASTPQKQQSLTWLWKIRETKQGELSMQLKEYQNLHSSLNLAKKTVAFLKFHSKVVEITEIISW